MPPGKFHGTLDAQKAVQKQGKMNLADASRKFHGISDVQKSIAEIWMRRKQLFMDFAGTQNQRDKTSAGRFAG